MFMPDAFAVADPEEIERVLLDPPLGCLVTRDAGGFFATHLPMIYDPARRTLMGHVSAANPHPERSGDGEALVVFQGANAYVTPSWYPSKAQHGRVVPTWNYETAHVTGALVWRREPAWLRDLLGRLTARFEAGRPRPWSIEDAPADYVARQLAAIVGVEIAVREVQVKRKLSQNRSAEDRAGVVQGLLSSKDAGDRRVGELMQGDAPPQGELSRRD
jgi:transcriptional regulator